MRIKKFNEFVKLNELNHQSVGATLGANQPGYGQGAHYGDWGVNYGSSNKSVRSTFGEKGNSIDPHLPGQKEKQDDFPNVIYDPENDTYLTGDDIKDLLNEYSIRCKQNSEVPQEFSNVDSETVKFIQKYLNN